MKKEGLHILKTLLVFVAFFSLPAIASAVGTNSLQNTQYTPGQPVSATCYRSDSSLELYDISFGIDNVPSDGLDMGNFPCGAPITFDGTVGHTYALLEIGIGRDCGGSTYANCLLQTFVLGEANFTVGNTSVPNPHVGSIPSQLTLDNSQYTPGEAAVPTCQFSNSQLVLYDISFGIDGVTADDSALGGFACNAPASFSGFVGHTYALLEIAIGGNCSNSYDNCKIQDFLRGEADFTVSSTSVSNSGGGSSSFGLPKSIYSPNEAVQPTCKFSGSDLQLYDISFGVDAVPAGGLNLGRFSCGSPVSFNGSVGHNYAVLEIAPSGSCDFAYAQCQIQNYLRAEYDFTIAMPPNIGGVESPEITLLAPNAGDVFSKQAAIKYVTTATDNVVLYYSTTLANWDGSSIDPSDRTLISSTVSPQGPYLWDTSQLPSGASYRVILDAVGQGGNFSEAVSGLFSIDHNAPQFSVSANPPATRGANVTLGVSASKALSAPPTVVVTQQGGAPIPVVMQMSTSTGAATSTYFEGVYTVVPGHDGVAGVMVSGTDMAGNSGATVVSGGAFAVGVNPPPAPRIAAPLQNAIVSTSTITVSGTTRPDTIITILVNGVDTYTAMPDKTGAFSVNNVQLSATDNRGVNTISVSAEDQAAVVSESVPVQVKYNLPPVVAIVTPSDTAVTIGATALLAVDASDPNNDSLQFTYQIISAQNFAGAASSTATSTNGWQTLASAVPSPHYQFDTTQFDDGQYYVRVIASDGIAQTYSDPLAVVIQNILPFLRFDDGSETITNTGPVTVAGHALEPAAISPVPTITTVEYSTDNGAHWATAPIDANGRFAVVFASTTAEGMYPVLWRVTDSRTLVGHTSHAIVVDKTPPQPPTISSPVGGAIITNVDDEDSVIPGMQVTIAGQAEPLSEVTLVTSGAGSTNSPQATAEAAVDGTFAFHDITLVPGANTVVLTATDQAGNVSSPSSYSFIYDNPPTIVFINPNSLSPGLTGMATVSWQINDTDNVPIQDITLQYRQGNGEFQTLVSNAQTDSFNWDVSNFPQGSDYELQLSASDGLATSTQTLGFAIDNTPPFVTSFNLDQTILGQSDMLQGAGEASDALSGVAYVEYAVMPEGQTPADADWYTALITKGFLQTQASYSITYPQTLGDGTYTVYARAVDAAGNVSPALSQTITVDTTPPRVGGFQVMMGNAVLAPDMQGNINVYASSTVQFGVSLEGDTHDASLVVNGTNIPLVQDIASGLWEASITTAATTSPILLNAEDNLGNAYSAKNIGAFTVIPTGSVTSNGEPVPGAVVYVRAHNADGSYTLIGTAPINQDGIYGLALPAGQYQLVMQAPGYATVVHSLTLEYSTLIGVSFNTEQISAAAILLQSASDYFSYGL